jgi:hypothetical protein
VARAELVDKQVILNEEGSVVKVEWAVDDHDEDFSAEVLRAAKFLGLVESAFLASVFDVPRETTECCLLFTTSVGEPPFTYAEAEDDELDFL